MVKFVMYILQQFLEKFLVFGKLEVVNPSVTWVRASLVLIGLKEKLAELSQRIKKGKRNEAFSIQGSRYLSHILITYSRVQIWPGDSRARTSRKRWRWREVVRVLDLRCIPDVGQAASWQLSPCCLCTSRMQPTVLNYPVNCISACSVLQRYCLPASWWTL